MPSVKFSSRLILLFLVIFSLSLNSCSFVPWMGDDEEESGFEDDFSFEEEAAGGEATSEADFFGDEGDFDQGFDSVDQSTDQNEMRTDLENLQGQTEDLKAQMRELQEIIRGQEARISATQERLEGNLRGVQQSPEILESEINEMRSQMALMQEELVALKIKKIQRPTRRAGRSTGISRAFKSEYGQALTAHRKGSYEESLMLFQNLEMKNPPSSYKDNVVFWIGINHVKLEMYDEAIQRFQTVLDEYPRENKIHDSRYWLGFSYHRQGDPSRAIDILESALRANPPNETRVKIEQLLSTIQ